MSARHRPPARANEAGVEAFSGHRALAVASSGGHLKQLVCLVARIPGAADVTWLTYDRGPTAELLQRSGRGGDRIVHADYAAPRDVPNLLRNARTAAALLRADEYDLVISTGAGVAVAILPLARARGIRSVFIETATRAQGPSLTGRILQRVPGIELYTQHRGNYGSRWRMAGSVLDEFERGPDREVTAVRKVVVTVGTIKPYGFRRLIEKLLQILPEGVDVLWQTGATEVDDLPIEAREMVPASELEAAMVAADVVVAHAGMGTAMTAFELGRCPVLVPRRSDANEHIDDHQLIMARELARRGLAIDTEVERLDMGILQASASRTVRRPAVVPPLAL